MSASDECECERARSGGGTRRRDSSSGEAAARSRASSSSASLLFDDESDDESPLSMLNVGDAVDATAVLVVAVAVAVVAASSVTVCRRRFVCRSCACVPPPPPTPPLLTSFVDVASDGRFCDLAARFDAASLATRCDAFSLATRSDAVCRSGLELTGSCIEYDFRSSSRGSLGDRKRPRRVAAFSCCTCGVVSDATFSLLSSLLTATDAASPRTLNVRPPGSLGVVSSGRRALNSDSWLFSDELGCGWNKQTTNTSYMYYISA